jgi:O-antigen ligase
MKEMELEQLEGADDQDQVDGTPKAYVKHSRLSTFALLLLAVIPMVAVAAYGSVDAWALGLQSLLVGLLTLVWIADVLVKGKLELNFNIAPLPLLALIFIGLVQIIPFFGSPLTETFIQSKIAGTISLDPFATKFAIIQLVVYLLYFLAALHFLNTARRLRGMVYWIIVFCAVAAFFGILQFLTKPDAIYGLRPTPFAEPFGPYVNKHHFAALMEMSLGISFALFLGHQSSREKKMLLLIAMVLAGTSIVLTGSRGGVLSAGVVALFVLVATVVSTRMNVSEAGMDQGRSGNLISSGILLVTIAALVIGSVFMLGGDSSLIRGFGVVESEDFSTGRIHFWQVTWEVIKSSPLVGVGFDSLAVAFTQFDTWNGTARVEQSHNDYLQIFAEAGVFGLISVIAFILIVFKKGIRNVDRHGLGFSRSMVIGALGGLLGVLVHSFFDFPLRTPSNGFFFIILTVFATSNVRFHIQHQERRRKSKKSGWSSFITTPKES